MNEKKRCLSLLSFRTNESSYFITLAFNEPCVFLLLYIISKVSVYDMDRVKRIWYL